MSTWLSVWTVVALIIFLGITVWALQPARKQEFEQAARIPLDDDTTDRIERGER